MITFGTESYNKAQAIAREVKYYADINKYNKTYFEMAFDKLGAFISKIQELTVFAAQVAQTVDKSMNPYNFQVARISEKQAWILACAAVENNIEF